MSIYSIRRAEQADESFLWEALYHAIYVAEGQPLLPREIVSEPDIAKYVDNWGKKGDEGYIAYNQVTLEPIGAIWIRAFSKENQGYGYIDENFPELSIAILPEYRNQGVGTHLIDKLISETTGKYPGVSLSVSFDNPAVRLYKRFGFEVVDQKTQSLTMVKVLNNDNPITT
ncbi:MAG: GNAT family N-acetyltransferase [Acidobacteriota bacterium]|nr:MAG: GNAT family N-acetyltransferase [Acidobacteriota bacterium]